MKKLILSCLSALLLSGAARAQLAYGPELGVNLSNYKVVFPGFFGPTTIPIPGAHIGGVLNYSFSDHLAIEPAAYFAINGIKYRYDLFIFGSVTAAAHINTIRVPVNLEYYFGEPGGNRFFVGGGPFLALNLGGSAKVSASSMLLDSLVGSSSFDTSGKITSGSDSSDFIKKFDFGVGLNAGYQLANGLYIRASYSRGLLNLTPVAGVSTNSIRSVNYAISVGYLFGDRPKKKAKAETTGRKK